MSTERTLNHPDNEEALDTIDALIFSGDPEEHELDRIEEFCYRWLRGCKEHRESRNIGEGYEKDS
jgi:hypothetical protein